MIDLSEIPKALKETIDSLTNLVGVVENNIGSFLRISSVVSARKDINAISKSLSYTADLYNTNTAIMSKINILNADPAILREDYDPEYGQLMIEKHSIDLKLRADCHNFINQLDQFSEFLEKFKDNIISVDYKIYETLNFHISVRKRTANYLINQPFPIKSSERLRSISHLYLDLMEATVCMKDMLQDTLRILKSAEEEKISKKPSEDKGAKDS